ncbi:hypothetical protein LINJ_27_2280 [Leishmania infantum JPCM5]|uniref:Uncharacterized protein n=2 Tax=Leishmania infantum TaxID=5671 RepID=E9AHG2_LEIIN|nr:hypothetical protein LINJ_27_2280 [Leishmania infantum JPCM5]CAC9500782.1 hypothetical_protein_-_conserved [Leishmania infantum]CBZ08844.1 hypothetical protein LINJ_27_2280 [Leishmania infantum JPCM5]SUZ43137.1 hypothetical_protein_-_conserved [Leishmania infantum]|eukprot:XP_003392663.1 hypothetical protein LINJ_27_2280 [Leishmania infantum JPCM5]
MDTDLLLTLSSFCRVRMQARPVFSTESRTFVDDVDTFIKHWQRSRSEQTATLLAFLKAVAYASVEAETRREQLIGSWLLCSLLMERKADVGKLYWQCERARRILPLSLRVNRFGVDERDSSVLGSLSLTSEAARSHNKGMAPTSFSSDSVKGFRKEIRAVEAAGAYNATLQAERDSQTSELDFVLPECAESKDVVIFCAQMIEKRKCFRSCCVRRLDDCCHAKHLEACLTESGVQVVFVQQSINKQLKEAFRRQKVLFLERLGRRTVDASEKTLRWTIFENFSDWFFFIRAKPSQTSWRCWATTTQHQCGLTLKLRIRHRPKNTRESTGSIQRSSYGAVKKPVLREVNSKVLGTEGFGTGGDVEAFLLRSSFLAALLCGCADGEGNGGGENAVLVMNYEISLRILDAVCQLCRVLM